MVEEVPPPINLTVIRRSSKTSKDHPLSSQVTVSNSLYTVSLHFGSFGPYSAAVSTVISTTYTDMGLSNVQAFGNGAYNLFQFIQEYDFYFNRAVYQYSWFTSDITIGGGLTVSGMTCGLIAQVYGVFNVTTSTWATITANPDTPHTIAFFGLGPFNTSQVSGLAENNNFLTAAGIRSMSFAIPNSNPLDQGGITFNGTDSNAYIGDVGDAVWCKCL